MMVDGITPFKSSALASIAVSRMTHDVSQTMAAHEAIHAVQAGSQPLYDAATKVKVMNKVVTAFASIFTHNTLSTGIVSSGDEYVNGGVTGGVNSGSSRSIHGSLKTLSRANSATKMASSILGASAQAEVTVPDQPAPGRTFLFS
jgi:hypothetical protein